MKLAVVAAQISAEIKVSALSLERLLIKSCLLCAVVEELASGKIREAGSFHESTAGTAVTVLVFRNKVQVAVAWSVRCVYSIVASTMLSSCLFARIAQASRQNNGVNYQASWLVDYAIDCASNDKFLPLVGT